MRKFKLTPSQLKVVSSAFSNIGQAIVLFSLAAFFVPEAVGLIKDFSKLFAFLFFWSGWFFVLVGVIIAKRSE